MGHLGLPHALVRLPLRSEEALEVPAPYLGVEFQAPFARRRPHFSRSWRSSSLSWRSRSLGPCICGLSRIPRSWSSHCRLPIRSAREARSPPSTPPPPKGRDAKHDIRGGGVRLRRALCSERHRCSGASARAARVARALDEDARECGGLARAAGSHPSDVRGLAHRRVRPRARAPARTALGGDFGPGGLGLSTPRVEPWCVSASSFGALQRLRDQRRHEEYSPSTPRRWRCKLTLDSSRRSNRKSAVVRQRSSFVVVLGLLRCHFHVGLWHRSLEAQELRRPRWMTDIRRNGGNQWIPFYRRRSRGADRLREIGSSHSCVGTGGCPSAVHDW